MSTPHSGDFLVFDTWTHSVGPSASLRWISTLLSGCHWNYPTCYLTRWQICQMDQTIKVAHKWWNNPQQELIICANICVWLPNCDLTIRTWLRLFWWSEWSLFWQIMLLTRKSRLLVDSLASQKESAGLFMETRSLPCIQDSRDTAGS